MQRGQSVWRAKQGAASIAQQWQAHQKRPPHRPKHQLVPEFVSMAVKRPRQAHAQPASAPRPAPPPQQQQSKKRKADVDTINLDSTSSSSSEGGSPPAGRAGGRRAAYTQHGQAAHSQEEGAHGGWQGAAPTVQEPRCVQQS